MEDAALLLYERQGLAATTAQQIAAAAGTTERTFYRHFGDKVEVAFGDETRLQAVALAAVASAPSGVAPWTVVQNGLLAITVEFDNRQEAMLRRARVVAANRPLHERELSRGAAWGTALSAALVDREVSEDAAVVCASMALAMFRTALDRWLGKPEVPLEVHLRQVFTQASNQVAEAQT